MLDIYGQRSESPEGALPDESSYLGSISLEDHMNLAWLHQELESRGLGLSYFEDFFLTAKQVEEAKKYVALQVQTRSKSSKNETSNMRDLLKIFSIASASGTGIAGYCD